MKKQSDVILIIKESKNEKKSFNGDHFTSIVLVALFLVPWHLGKILKPA